MNHPLVIFDAKGSVIHSYHRGEPQDVLSTWISGYFEPAKQFTTPRNMVAVWDGGDRLRRNIFPQYKEKRRAREAKADKVEAAEIEAAMSQVKRTIADAGGINMAVPTVEADDVIALLCEKITDRPIVIYTRDSDLLQLASDNVTVCYCDSWPDEYKGHPLKYVRLYKAVCGDSSDGFTGVPGVGEVAFNYLAETYGYDGLDELEEWLATDRKDLLEEAVAGSDCKVVNKILTNWSSARLGYCLACLYPKACWGVVGSKVIKPQFQVSLPVGVTYTLVTQDNFEDCVKFFKEELPKTSVVAFDHETYDSLKHRGFINALPASRAKKGYVDVLSQRLTGTSFCFGDNNQYVFYFSVNHSATANVDKSVVLDLVQLVLSSDVDLVAHNANFEEQVLKQEFGVAVGTIIDTCIQSSYVDEDSDSGLKDLSLKWFAYQQTTYEQLLEQYGAEDMRDLTGEQVLEYGCDDSLVTAALHNLFKLIMQIEGSYEYYCSKELGVMPELNRSYEGGVSIDYEELARQEEKDAALVVSNMASIRSTLEQHCTSPNQEAADAFFKADLDHYRLQLVGTGELNHRQVLSRLEGIRLSMADRAVYTPMTEVVLPPKEVVATPTTLAKVATAIFGTEVQSPKSVSVSAINRWVMGLSKLDVTEDATLFVTLVAEAAGELKVREGEKYAALISFCESVLKLQGKVVTEGDELNLGSPKQMQELLYLKMALPVRVRTDPQPESFRAVNGLEGSPATNEEAMLLAIAEDCPEGDWRREVLTQIIEVKAAETRASLYWKPYPWWRHPVDGAIHPGIRNCGTGTRRPSGTSPNVLQVAKNEVRKIFIPRYTGEVIVSLDFNGQELRITGSESKDPVLIDCYTGLGSYVDEYGVTRTRIRDVHCVTGSGVAHKLMSKAIGKQLLDKVPTNSNGIIEYDFFFNVAKGNTTNLLGLNDSEFSSIAKSVSAVRKAAKTVNFLIIYGGSAYTLAKKLGIPVIFAEEVMEAVFRQYPRLAPWQEETIAKGRKFGYVETAYGNRRHLSNDIVSQSNSLRSRMERQAVNFTVQGTAADILKVVLSEAYRTSLFKETKAHLYFPPYDEITSSVPIDSCFEFSERLQDIMNLTPPGHIIPMMAEVSIGMNWYEQTELGDRPAERKITNLIESLVRKERK